ncbi:hypothetical protein [Bacteroides sp.]|uniref:hypothetical protein n=1 Tax=Bacteroides sp. TaxID=29523 RepID=UPI002630D851|nr:hypothetical protein [Bacteroides sp.]MDD3039773.1 hypothetical protein [Bacteroides sp.]
MTNNNKNNKNSKKAVQATKAVQAMQAVDCDYESELLLKYQQEVNAAILKANIEEVNASTSSQEHFIRAFALLCKQDSDFTIKALSYKSKQRDLLYRNQKILYFTDNFVNVTKTQANKYNVKIMSIKKYNHSYCYNIAVESYASYEAIKQLVMSLIA